MMGAFMEGAYFNPRKKKEIFIVMPKIESRINLDQSFFSI